MMILQCKFDETGLFTDNNQIEISLGPYWRNHTPVKTSVVDPCLLRWYQGQLLCAPSLLTCTMKLCYRHHLSDCIWMHQLDHNWESFFPTASLEVSLGLAGWTYQIMVQFLQCMLWRQQATGGERITGSKTERFLCFLWIFVQCWCAGVRNDPSWQVHIC